MTPVELHLTVWPHKRKFMVNLRHCHGALLNHALLLAMHLRTLDRYLSPLLDLEVEVKRWTSLRVPIIHRVCCVSAVHTTCPVVMRARLRSCRFPFRYAF